MLVLAKKNAVLAFDTPSIPSWNIQAERQQTFSMLLEGRLDDNTIYILSLVFVCRENPRPSGILLFPDRPGHSRLYMKTRRGRGRCLQLSP